MHEANAVGLDDSQRLGTIGALETERTILGGHNVHHLLRN
jgi:hypothetical protein